VLPGDTVRYGRNDKLLWLILSYTESFSRKQRIFWIFDSQQREMLQLKNLRADFDDEVLEITRKLAAVSSIVRLCLMKFYGQNLLKHELRNVKCWKRYVRTALNGIWQGCLLSLSVMLINVEILTPDPVMLILVIGLVLKDSSRTKLKSLSLSWSLRVKSLSLSLSLSLQV